MWSASAPAEVRDRFTATAADGMRAAFALAPEGEFTLLHRICRQGGTVSDELIERVIDSVGTWQSAGPATARHP